MQNNDYIPEHTLLPKTEELGNAYYWVHEASRTRKKHYYERFEVLTYTVEVFRDKGGPIELKIWPKTGCGLDYSSTYGIAPVVLKSYHAFPLQQAIAMLAESN